MATLTELIRQEDPKRPYTDEHNWPRCCSCAANR